MVTPSQCLKKFGKPELESSMVLWNIPTELETGVIPKKLYCNKLMPPKLSQAFSNLISRGYISELKTWDGCFNVRKIKGSVSQSLHSWGLAIDVNATWNQMGHTASLSSGFIQCFTDSGFDWGGNFKRIDGMHFQLSEI